MSPFSSSCSQSVCLEPTVGNTSPWQGSECVLVRIGLCIEGNLSHCSPRNVGRTRLSGLGSGSLSDTSGLWRWRNRKPKGRIDQWRRRRRGDEVAESVKVCTDRRDMGRGGGGGATGPEGWGAQTVSQGRSPGRVKGKEVTVALWRRYTSAKLIPSDPWIKVVKVKQSCHYRSPGSRCSRSSRSLSGNLPPSSDPRTAASPGNLTDRHALDHCCLEKQRHQKRKLEQFQLWFELPRCKIMFKDTGKKNEL